MQISVDSQSRFLFRFMWSLPAFFLFFVLAGTRNCPAQSQQSQTAVVEKPSASRVISAEALEKDFGLKIIRIAVTAAGGMVDFRFRILDPEKAGQVLKEHGNLPVLVAVNSGVKLLPAKGMMSRLMLKKDAMCYILYANARSAVKAGVPVSAVFGSVHVQPIKAQ